MVNMKEKPFYLSDEDCKWVEDTIAGMTVDEKIGQLFFNMGSSREEDYLKMTVEKYHIGGIRYNPATADDVYEQNRILQENSKIPLIIACKGKGGHISIVIFPIIAQAFCRFQHTVYKKIPGKLCGITGTAHSVKSLMGRLIDALHCGADVLYRISVDQLLHIGPCQSPVTIYCLISHCHI